jgi:hypothetical protein
VTRWNKLKHIIGSPRGLSVLFGSSLVFLLITYFVNGQPNYLTIFRNTALTYTIPHYALLVLVSLLFGTSIAIFQNNISTASWSQQGGFSVASAFSILVSGCAGCAAGVIPGLLALFGLSGSILSLPLLGTELLIASFLLYVGIIYYLLSPSQCQVNFDT